MSEIKIKVYQSAEGEEPFSQWFKKLSFKDRQLVRTRLNRVRTGNFGDAKKISGARQLYELRIHIGAGIRIYFAKEGNKILILLCGGVKGTQLKDIKKAKEYLADYLDRRNM